MPDCAGKPSLVYDHQVTTRYKLMHMSDKIADFFRDVALENASSRTWGIGSVIARGGAKAALAAMPITVKTAEDQFLISENCETALPKTLEALKNISYGLKDPALFDVPTATFCVYMAFQAFGRMNAPCIVFVTMRPASEGSTHLLLEGHAKEPFNNKVAKGYVKKVREAISARFT